MARVTIERLGHIGDGIASGPIFAARCLPGEVVEGEILSGCIAAPRIVTPSHDRVAPPCRHYRGCGGCALQHASDHFVAAWKVEVVRQALSAHGLAAPIRGIRTSPAGARRRATFSGRRTKKGATVGFHAPGSEVIREVPDCLLVRPSLSAAIPALEEIVSAGGSRKGEMRLTVTDTLTGLDIAVVRGKPLDLDLRLVMTRIAQAADFARIAWGDEPVAIRRKPVLEFGGAQVEPPPGAFLQATAEGEAALAASVDETLDGVSGPFADLFAGCGTFALRLATRTDVHAVEGDAALLHALDVGWRRGVGLRHLTTERRDLFRRPLAADELMRFGGVVIDPPRAGAEAQTAELARAGVPSIAALSCNPVTFARDAAVLIASGYELRWIDVVDQFRWSPHVELAAAFRRL